MNKHSYKYILFLLTVIMLGLPQHVLALEEISKADSLRTELKKTHPDSVKINLLDALISEIRSTNPTEAYADAKLELELALAVGHKRQIAFAYNRLSLMCQHIGDYDKAIENTYKSLNLYEELKDTSNVAGGCLNLSTSFKAKGDFTKALSLLEKALGNFQKIKNKRGIAFCYNNIATIYRDQRKDTAALDYFRKSLALKTEIGEKRTLASVYMNMGIVQADREQYDSAFIDYSKARKLFLKYNELEGLADAYINLGELERNKKNYKESRVLLDSALLLAKSVQSVDALNGVYKTLYLLNKDVGNFKESLEDFEIFITFKDSTLNESSAKQVADMSARYESEKKDKDILLLKKQNEIAGVDDKKKQVFIGGLIAVVIGVILLMLLLHNRVKFRERMNAQLSHVNVQINEQKKEITDSIQYARRIQESILLKPEKIRDILPQSFLLYRPKQIVSGDFYWIHKNGDEVIVAVVDNVLHGVPGAFISLVGINLLNRAIQENPSRNLKEMVTTINTGIVSTLKQMRGNDQYSDKLNYAICRVNTVTKFLECITTDNTVYLIHPSGVRELKRGDESTPVLHQVQLGNDEMVCLFTDGYANQLGGKDGKKFMMKNLEELLVSSSNLPLSSQKEKLEATLDEWKKVYEQVDDILLIGFRA